MGESGALHCSFCGKARGEVLTLIAGPSAFICDECVALSIEVVADRKRAAAGTGRLSEEEVAAAAQAQGQAEKKLQYSSRSTTGLLKQLQEMRFVIDTAKREIADFVRQLRDRGVAAARIQHALGISPTDAVEQFLGPASPTASDAAEPAAEAWNFPEPVKQLILRAKASGQVTYDELNAALPPEDFSSEEIEDVLSVLSQLGTNVVEKADDE